MGLQHELPTNLQAELLKSTILHASIIASNHAGHTYKEALEYALMHFIKHNSALQSENLKIVSEACPRCVVERLGM